MVVQIQFRRGTASEWSSVNPTLADGEMGIETNTKLFKIGNGTDTWNNLDYGGLRGTEGPTGYTGSIGQQIVDNVLYVSKSGKDTNVGTSIGQSKLTIKGALAIATPGTTIFVKSGDYTEINPMVIPENVAILGDSLRTVTIRPKTRSADVFYVNNGSYVGQVTFKDHVAPSAAVSFNPDGSAGAITTSPYVQNSTSMTTTGTGMRVDGAYVTGLRSMVVDAFTQYNQGGIGIHMKNGGNTQLVSVFTICCETGFLCETGGFCSITNANSSFGTFALKADGVGAEKYSAKTVNTVSATNTFIMDNLVTKPSVGDAVKFEGDPTYYTVNSSTSFTSGNTVITAPNFSSESSGKITSRSNIYDAISTILVDTIDHLNEFYARLNPYDQDTCQRDVGFMIDAVAYDMLFGTNYNSVTAGNSYQRAAAIPANTVAQSSAAIKYLKTQALALTGINGVTNPTTRITNGFNEINDILLNGLTSADNLVFPTPSTLPTTNAVEAKDQLVANKAFIQREIVAFVDANFPTVTYDSAKCSRDVGYIVDGLCYDIMYGGNSASIQVARSYFKNFNDSTVGDIQIGNDEILATAAAFNRLGQVVGDCVIEADVVKTAVDGVVYGIPQNKSGTQASSTEVDELSGLCAIVENAIRENSDANIPAVVYPSIAWSATEYQTARLALVNAKSNLKTAVTTFLDTEYTGLVYDQFKCTRDLKIILESVADDMVFGTNYQTRSAAQSYYRASAATVTSDQLVETIAAIKFAQAELIAAVPGDSNVNVIANANINIITDALSNGLTGLPALSIPDPTGVSTGVLNAKANLIANKEFLVEDGIAYITNIYDNFTYTEAKCTRDLGLIIDGIHFDIALGTNFNSVYLGLSYQRAYNSVLLNNQVPQTVGAFEFARDLAKTTISAATSAEYTVLYRNTISWDEVVDVLQNGISSANAITWTDPSEVDTITTVVRTNNVATITTSAAHGLAIGDIVAITATDPTYDGTFTIQSVTATDKFTYVMTDNDSAEAAATGTVRHTNKDVKTNARIQMQNNRTFVIGKVIEYINANTPPAGYNQAKCERDIGYIIDAISYDLQYGGNTATRTAILSYFDGGGNAVLPLAQRTPSQNAYIELGTILGSIILETYAGQNISGEPATNTEVTEINTLITFVKNAVAEATLAAATIPTLSAPDITWATQVYQDGANALLGAKTTIQSSTITHINDNYVNFSYNSTKCKSDLRFIIDAITYDLSYGGNTETADAADEYYSGGYLVIPTAQRLITSGVYEHVKSVASQCISSTSVTKQPGNPESQTLGTAATSAESTTVDGLFDIVINLVKNAYRSTVTLEETITGPVLDNTNVTFHQYSLITASGHTFEWVGAGTNINTALPSLGGVPITENQVVEVNQGKVYYTGTDQDGDFRIGNDFVINRNTGTIEGRTFTKSLFARLTPYILAIGD